MNLRQRIISQTLALGVGFGAIGTLPACATTDTSNVLVPQNVNVDGGMNWNCRAGAFMAGHLEGKAFGTLTDGRVTLRYTGELDLGDDRLSGIVFSQALPRAVADADKAALQNYYRDPIRGAKAVCEKAGPAGFVRAMSNAPAFTPR